MSNVRGQKFNLRDMACAGCADVKSKLKKTLKNIWLFSKETASVFTQVVVIIFKSILKWVLPKKYKEIGNDIVLITGGGKGIGRRLAVELSKYHPKQIVLWGRTEDTLKATANAIRMRNVQCSYMLCDVSNRQQVYAKAKELQQTVGSVTMLVNNAGIVSGRDIVDSREEDMQKTIEVNVLGVCWTVKAFLPEMIKKNYGHIVNMNSALGIIALAGAADYSSSKFALNGLTEALREELDDHDGIHITSIHPFMVNTEMFAGCTTRFPRLFPPLDQDYVAQKTVDAILTNRPQVLLPRLLYFLWFFNSVIPHEAMLVISKFCGVDKAMQNFHGRLKT